MSLCDVKDNIVPIFLRDEIDDEDSKFQYIGLGLQDQQAVESTSASSSTYDDPLIVLEPPDIDEIDDLERGCLEENALQYLPLNPDNLTNCITITGQPVPGETLICVDHSALIDKFPIYSYEWVLSAEYGIRDKYDPKILSKTDNLLVDFNMIGKFIACRAHRIIEKQISLKDDHKINTKIYDPHVKIDPVQLENFAKKEVSVSFATIGPVLIPDEWALLLLEKLIESHLEFDVQFHIREDILAICGEFRYKHLYMSQVEEVDAKLILNYDKFILKFDDVKSEKVAEIFEIFGIENSISLNISTTLFNRDKNSTLLIENMSTELNQPYIIEVNNIRPKEYANYLFFICGCYKMSATYKITLEEWKNCLSQGNLHIVKYLVNKFLVS